MKKFLSMLLILCLFLGALPAQALAYVADNIQRADTVEQVSVGNSSLVLLVQRHADIIVLQDE